MHILVTGASGFLGRSLCTALRCRGDSVTELYSQNGDLTDPKSLHAWNAISFDQIYHLAAWTQAGDFCLKHSGEQWIINQHINTNVLTWWKEVQPQAKMIAIGTSCGYDPKLPLEESYYLQGMPLDSLMSYAMTKRMLLYGLIALHRQWGLRYLYLIPSTLYGVGYFSKGKQMHFIFDLMRKILRGKKKGDPVVFWGDGTQKRELIHIQDFVSAALYIVSHYENIWMNVGSGEEYTILDFAKRLCTYMEFSYNAIHFDRNQHIGAHSKVLDISRFKSMMPHHDPIPLDMGLKETSLWYLEHGDALSY